MRKASGEDGFTLVELLVVLVILALLAGIVGPKVIGYLGDSRIKTARIQMASYRTALELFHLDIGRFPNSGEGLKALAIKPFGVDDWRGPYLDKPVSADPWGHAYLYASPGSKAAYELYRWAVMASRVAKVKMRISGNSRDQAGFSLIEMLLVLVILGMAAGLAAGRIRASGVDWEAASLASFLREMRADAMLEGHRLDAALQPSPFRLAVSRGHGAFNFARASEVTAQPLSFYRDGGSSGAVITVRRNAESYVVQVEPLTGRVSRVR